MENKKSSKLRTVFRSCTKVVICILCVALFVVWVMSRPETVASGNGYSHQVGSFGECDMRFDGCTGEATHRRHHLFENKDFCESCWNPYGQDMFERLSKTESKSNGLEYDEYKCRHTGCDKRAKSSDWDYRFCEEHLQGMKYCRYPNCSEQIPINGTTNYCWKHK